MLFFILIFGFYLRIEGNTRGLDFETNRDLGWDSDSIAIPVGSISLKELTPHYWIYPATGLDLLYATIFPCYLAAVVAGYDKDPVTFFTVDYPAYRTWFIRISNALISIFAVALSTFLAARWVSSPYDLAATVTMVLFSSNILEAHYAIIDPLNLLMITWAMILVFDYSKSPTLSGAVRMGIGAGLATGIKYSGGATILPAGIALLFAIWKDSEHGKDLLAFVFAVLLSFLLFNHSLIFAPSEVISGFTGQLNDLTPEVSPDGPQWLERTQRLLSQLLKNTSWQIGMVSLAGYLGLLLLNPKVVLLFVVFLLAYLAELLYLPSLAVAPRHVMVLEGFLAAGIALAIAHPPRLLGRLGKITSGIILALLVISLTTKVSVVRSVLSLEETRTKAARYLMTNLSDEAIILMEDNKSIGPGWNPNRPGILQHNLSQENSVSSADEAMAKGANWLLLSEHVFSYIPGGLNNAFYVPFFSSGEWELQAAFYGQHLDSILNPNILIYRKQDEIRPSFSYTFSQLGTQQDEDFQKGPPYLLQFQEEIPKHPVVLEYGVPMEKVNSQDSFGLCRNKYRGCYLVLEGNNGILIHPSWTVAWTADTIEKSTTNIKAIYKVISADPNFQPLIDEPQGPFHKEFAW